MAPTPAKGETKNAAGPAPKQPPDERFWRRYSPHHELPVSVLASITLHGLAIAALIFLGVAAFSRAQEELKPPRMELVEIQGGDGGLDGLGVGNTPLGGDGGKDKAENVENLGGDKTPRPQAQQPKDTQIAAIKEPLKVPELQVPETGKDPPESSEDSEAFAQLTQTAKKVKKVEDNINQALQTRPVPPPATSGKSKGGVRTGNSRPGTGGPAGKGGGKGGNIGPGSGSSPYGQVLTNQQKRQHRWRILASDDGRIHLAKLKALKVTLVVPTNQPNVFKIMDLAQSSPTFRLTDQLRNQGDKVWWTNSDPRQVLGLASVMGLRPVPPCFVIFLPKGLEDRMVDLESQYQGAREEQIQQTIWDVPLRDGQYASEPVVAQQILKGQR